MFGFGKKQAPDDSRTVDKLRDYNKRIEVIEEALDYEKGRYERMRGVVLTLQRQLAAQTRRVDELFELAGPAEEFDEFDDEEEIDVTPAPPTPPRRERA